MKPENPDKSLEQNCLPVKGKVVMWFGMVGKLRFCSFIFIALVCFVLLNNNDKLLVNLVR